MRREIVFGAISLPVVISIVALGNYYYDLPVSAFMRGSADWIVSFLQVVTYLGVSTWYLICFAFLSVFFFYMVDNRTLAKRMVYLFLVVAVSGLTTDAIKLMMGRWRPNALVASGLYGFEFFGWGYEQTSFPSGHATTICSLATALIFLYPRLRLTWITIAILVCVSRIVIGAHYPSDVIMGAYVGIFAAFLLRKLPMFKKSIEGRSCLESGDHQNY
ncbi:MAG: phosphatase PAP2 family protein [Syntrophales bacterium]|nr:phosphatase PAP2 family protein [Syntrophales bacterium]